MPRSSKIYDDFVVFILSHGKPENVLTVNTLKRHGYTGNWYIVLDDQDLTFNDYRAKFGKDHVLIFNKDKVAEETDEFGSNLGDKNTILYARNACFELAKRLGYTYFMELDDDYYEFNFRYENDGKLTTLAPTNLDLVFEAVLEYYISIPQFKSIALAQNGDFLGGIEGSHFKQKFLRKAMNSFICSTERPFKFMGRVNEDVNTYSLLGSRGELFGSIMDIGINQIDTQQKKSGDGMTDVYKGDGTYTKSFYTVMCCPSFTKIGIVGNNHARIHHNVDWKHAVPKIISSEYKKEVD